ncbi:general amidase [Coprinopsis sp. MPI-PUGE-AT-0042]|nr:general amidase [Coprinopsis sp. MPI-PUGE-AT-0042]
MMSAAVYLLNLASARFDELNDQDGSEGKPSWRRKVEEKRARQRACIPDDWIIPTDKMPSYKCKNVMSIPESCGILTEREIEITRCQGAAEKVQRDGVDVLLKKLREGEWSAVEVTTAFAKRAVIAHQLVNCLTEIFIDKALEQAKKLDEHLKRTGKPVGPLHGLPISLKDQINVEGIESTMGYVSWIGEYEDKNAVIVNILMNLGAIPYVKTNVPQTLMWDETFNHVFGRTVNPHNRSLTSGGSSGGEGCTSMGGSPLGVGSDIGGSIRTPSGFCESAPSVLGPMAPTLSALKLFMTAIIGAEPTDYHLREHGGGKGPLCFGVIWHDDYAMPHPPVLRALEETKQALIKAGHKVVDWKPLKHKEIHDVICEVFAAGSAEDFENVCAKENEPLISSMSSPTDSKGKSAYDLWQVQKHKQVLRKEYLDHWESSEKWAETGTGRPVDALICPIAAYVAPPHGKHQTWNALDYPALVIPVSTVDQEKDAASKLVRHEFFTDFDKENYEGYDPKTYEEAPISIQVVARTLEEEALIAMSEIVDKALRAQRGEEVKPS